MTDQTQAPAKPKRTRMKAMDKAPATKGTATQAAAPKTPARKPADKKTTTRKAPAGKGGQQQGTSALSGMDAARAHLSGKGGAGQTGDAPQQQGAGTASEEKRGGTKQVLIKERVLPGRGGRPQGPEEYPFGDLTPARKEGTEIKGPSFFIPEKDNPDQHLATARKRYKGDRSFWSRGAYEKDEATGEMIKGTLIFRASDD